MAENPQLALSGIVLDAPDASELASFYQRLLGWEREQDEPGWVKLRSPVGGPGLSFQTESAYVRPTWPAGRGDQQTQVHLDIVVDDLDAAEAHALAVGATAAQYRPDEDCRTYFDPAGHPFCLFVSGGSAEPPPAHS